MGNMGNMMREECLMRPVTHYADGSGLTSRYVDETVLTLPDGDGAGLKWTDATNCMQEVRWVRAPHGEVGEGDFDTKQLTHTLPTPAI